MKRYVENQKRKKNVVKGCHFCYINVFPTYQKISYQQSYYESHKYTHQKEKAILVCV
jgi:hypothetical protein